MKLTKDMCYQIIQAKDARFDGVFYTAVKTTGVYCRPVCKVPAPKKENCQFFDTAVQAEIAGFRPCLRCRPEMAPEYSEFEQSDLLIRHILMYFEEQNYCPGLIQKSATHFGVSARHVHRLFHMVLGISPLQYIMTKRLLNGKRLLQDTLLSVTEIAGLIGFGSANRFYQTLKKKYGLTPKDIRCIRSDNKIKDWIKVKLSYRPPYRWRQMMDFFRTRAIPKVEWVDEYGVYRRTLQIVEDGHLYGGCIEVQPIEEENAVVVKISSSLEKGILQVIRKVRRTFDLDAFPQVLPDSIDQGTRLPGCFDGFEMALRAILGQQITVKAATTLAGRVAQQFGTAAETPWFELNCFFPGPGEFVNSDEPIENALGALGVIEAKSKTIKSLAESVLNKELSFEELVEADKFIKKIMKIKGIGIWTAQYVAMRSLSWPDIFLVSDLGIKQTLMKQLKDENGYALTDNHSGISSYKLNKKYEIEAANFAEAYKPWRSYLTMAIWHDVGV